MSKFSLKSKLDAARREDLLLDFFKSLASIKNPAESAQVLFDLLSPQEIDMIAKRLAIARSLIAGKDYQSIAKDLKVSTGTIARVNAWLHEAGEGIRMIVRRVSFDKRNFGKDKVYSKEERLTCLKRQYPQYFWPQLLLERIVELADKKEKLRLQTIIRQSKKKTQLLKRIDKILKIR